ncbi:MAG TPA: hypothetical protein VFK02_29055 [Kofleriaceae bacterium]|nr:hypothetical protein [Kofleriaceae bacterium]
MLDVAIGCLGELGDLGPWTDLAEPLAPVLANLVSPMNEASVCNLGHRAIRHRSPRDRRLDLAVVEAAMRGPGDPARPQKSAHQLDVALVSRSVPARKKMSGRSASSTRSPEISLRLDGDDVHPHNVDPSLVLALASSNDFSLLTGVDMARALGGHLYREVEIEAEIARNEIGAISEGRLWSFEPVESTDPIEAWDKWFEQSAGDWDDARVEALLGGRRD